jgi:hypothetical protein
MFVITLFASNQLFAESNIAIEDILNSSASGRCKNLSDYTSTCQSLEPTDKCSAALTKICCECQEAWGVNLKFCGFPIALLPTPEPTPTLQPTSSPSPTPVFVDPNGSPTPLPTIEPTASIIPTPILGVPIVQPSPENGVKPTTEVISVCNDGIDNDGDGFMDYLSDPGCSSITDDSECNPLLPKCDNCIDDDKDGKIDLADEECLNGSDPTESANTIDNANNIPETCTKLVIEQEKANLLLPFKRIVDAARRSHKFIKRSPRLTKDEALRMRLKASSIKLSKKITQLSSEAHVALNQLPDVIIVCPDNTPSCKQVDDRSIIQKYVTTVTLLGNYALKSLNRGTRLVFSLSDAQKITKPMGKRVREARNDLLKNAKAIPAIQTQCN